MERARWTDDRLDKQMALIDAKFDRGLDEMRALREEMRVGFASLRGELGIVRGELVTVRGDITGMRGDISELRGDVMALQRQMTQIFAGFAIALLGAIGAGLFAAF